MSQISRRTFLKSAGFASGGLVVGFSLSGCGSTEIANPISRVEGGFFPNAFIQITKDNKVRFYCPRDEMGQGITTGLSSLIAEELDVSIGEIDIRFGPAHPDYNNPEYGMQVTGGSTSMRGHFQQLRQAAANTRALLLEAAANQLSEQVSNLQTEDGHILRKGQRVPYGDFVAAAQSLNLLEDAKLKDKSEFKVIGKDFPRLDALEKSTGTAMYGIDAAVDGMHYAVLKRCPVAGGKVSAFNAESLSSMLGVVEVVQISNGVAAVAESFWQAKKAAAAIEIEWDLPKLSKINSAQIEADYQSAMDNDSGDLEIEQGNLVAGFEGSDTIVEQQYWAPYLAHATMEPMNALVHIQGDRADVWTGTQAPQLAQGLVARYANLKKRNVKVHNSYLGGGFGRRAFSSYVIEATELAVATGKPIKLVWTREDDIQNGSHRPASMMKKKAGVDQEGKITAWSAKRVGANITPDTIAAVLPTEVPSAVPTGLANWAADISGWFFNMWSVDHAGIEGLSEDYDLPNTEVRHVNVNHGIPLTYWRSVGHSFTAFAKESLIDELANQASLDPIEFRLNNTQNNPRLNNVIKQLRDKISQLDELGAGRALGISAHGSFHSYVAQAAEISVENNQIRVHKVICAVDCGLVVNPDIVRAQMEGAIMFGLTAALHGKLDIENGAIKQSNFHDYPILRMNEAPAVEVVIIDSDEAPSGVGEPGLPPIAPAVANAVFKLSGQRLRSLPLKLA